VDESTFQSVMQTFDFRRVGTLQMSAGRFRYALTNDMSGEGFVYLWVERQTSRYSIVYVGMAGKSLRARCEQHLGGFRQSTTGKAHANVSRQVFLPAVSTTFTRESAERARSSAKQASP
jgi:hypothetical protein